MNFSLRKALRAEISEALNIPVADIELQFGPAEFCDFSSNIAFRQARARRTSPKALAAEYAAALAGGDGFIGEATALNGYLNLRVRDGVWRALLCRPYMRPNPRSAQPTVVLEYVSSNPTGPLHVGHTRGAVLGSCLAGLLREAGWDVLEQFYINDAGNQIRLFRQSWDAWVRWCAGATPEAVEAAAAGQTKVDPGLPEGGYGGAYMARYAREWAAIAPTEMEDPVEFVLADVRRTLAKIGVNHLSWASEKELGRKLLPHVLALLEKGGWTERRDGKVWFLASSERLPGAYREAEDKVLIRDNGEPTYFAGDVVLHWWKYLAGARYINLWGADHHGHIARLKGAVWALGLDPEHLEIQLCQMVRLERDGVEVPMSKRSGDLIELAELHAQVGKDAIRWHFADRDPNTPMTFDLARAVRTHRDNPLHYVQYSIARARKMLAATPTPPPKNPCRPDKLDLPVERELALKLLAYQDTLEAAAEARAVNAWTLYLKDLAETFHRYYESGAKIVDPGDHETTGDRTLLVGRYLAAMERGLDVLGITPVESM